MSVVRSWRLLVLLLPVALVGVLGRVYYTPDEPREASLVVAMAQQAQHALPELGGRPFAEKPPLLYWLGAASVTAFGATPAAARLPNVLYLLVAALAIGALAARAAGPAAGFAAAMVAATALQLYLVLIWLATDAPLVAGVALALLGMHLGLGAATSRARLAGYLVLHAGLAVAFFAKGLAGWMVPLLAFATVLALERRGRELARWELWAGTPLVLAAIGAWVLCVTRLPDGAQLLRVLFWYNLVGRALSVAAPAEYLYAAGHLNWPGKYLVELPLYLLPWSPLALAAARRAWRRARSPGSAGTAWRIALGAIVPATLLLSLAATARGVYYGPPALGFALLIGLYVAEAGTALDRFDRACWRLTGALVAATALLVGALAALALFSPAGRQGAYLVTGGVAVASALLAAWLVLRAPRAAGGAFPRYALALAAALSLAAGPLYHQLNTWLSLEASAARVLEASGDARLLLLYPDETTIAMTQLYMPAGRLRDTVLASDPDAAARARRALGGPGAATRILWPVPGPSRWNAGAWLAFLGYGAGRAPEPQRLELPGDLGELRLECLLTRPGGRTLAILAPTSVATPPGPCH